MFRGTPANLAGVLEPGPAVPRPLFVAAAVLGVVLAAYMIYTTLFGPYRTTLLHRAIFLGASLVIYFLVCKPLGGGLRRGLDVGLAVAALVTCGYIVLEYDHIARLIGAPLMTRIDLAVGIVLVALVLEAARRQSLIFLALAVLCIAYTLGGAYLFGILEHPGIGFRRFIFLNVFGPEGIFGVGLAVATNYLFMFILFGAALRATGTSDFLLRFSNAAVGRFSGGAAKVSLIGSAVMGSVMGSSIANVVTTGTVTIPVMIRSGYTPEEAAAIEVLNSEGAQLVPPVLGAAVFVMAEITGIPYPQLVIASLVPAFLYYAAAFAVIHFSARRKGLSGIPAGATSTWFILRQGWHLLVPIAVLFVMILEFNVTAAMAGLVAIASAIVLGQLRRSSRIPLRGLVSIFVDGSRDAATLTGLIASIGLIQQALTITGLGARSTEVLLAVSGGSELGLIVAGLVATIVLGMGLPTPIAYVLAAIFVAPAIIDMGFSVIATHMFLLFFAIKSGSTPPIAIVAVVAAAIAKADWLKTALLSFWYSVPGWLVAFAFLYQPALLLQSDDPWTIAQSVVTATAGVVAMSAALSGFFLRPIGVAGRAIMVGAAAALIAADPWSDLAGVVVIGTLLLHRILVRTAAKA